VCTAFGDRGAFAIAIGGQESHSCASVTFHNILDRMPDLIPFADGDNRDARRDSGDKIFDRRSPAAMMRHFQGKSASTPE
jgi:hypothetical protein